jgi:hypothetical protein
LGHPDGEFSRRLFSHEGAAPEKGGGTARQLALMADSHRGIFRGMAKNRLVFAGEAG